VASEGAIAFPLLLGDYFCATPTVTWWQKRPYRLRICVRWFLSHSRLPAAVQVSGGWPASAKHRQPRTPQPFEERGTGVRQGFRRAFALLFLFAKAR